MSRSNSKGLGRFAFSAVLFRRQPAWRPSEAPLQPRPRIQEAGDAAKGTNKEAAALIGNDPKLPLPAPEARRAGNRLALHITLIADWPYTLQYVAIRCERPSVKAQ